MCIFRFVFNQHYFHANISVTFDIYSFQFSSAECIINANSFHLIEDHTNELGTILYYLHLVIINKFHLTNNEL